MNCLVCNKESNYLFCFEHIPKWKQIIRTNHLIIFHGKFYTLMALYYKLFTQKKIINWWLGTDSLTLDTTPPGSHTWHLRLILHRIKWKLLYKIVDIHWVGCIRVYDDIYQFGIRNITFTAYPPLYPEPVGQKLNILVHTHRSKKNNKYKDWFYGIDFINQLREIGYCNLVEANGAKDMRNLFPLVDCCVLPKRLAGRPRLQAECVINNIPCYYNDQGEPKIDEIINFIEEQWRRKQNHI